MKTKKNLYNIIASRENLDFAASKAVSGKRYGLIRHFLSNRETLLDKLHYTLMSCSYTPSSYREMYIYEPKERLIKIAAFYPDRIVHHAVMNVVEPILKQTFIHHTYACIKGRGGHKCINDLYSDMTHDYSNTQYCLKFDIRKFYDSIDHEILKSLIRRKISDQKALNLIDQIIDSTSPGIPIGNYTSQQFSNYYLAYFDHYCKEELNIKYYYRYMDDIVVLGSNKAELHDVLKQIKTYLRQCLNLEIKDNWQVFPVDKRQIDFSGYRVNHHNIMLRKRILYNYFKRLRKYKGRLSSEDDLKHAFPSHYGWLKHISDQHRKLLIHNSINS